MEFDPNHLILIIIFVIGFPLTICFLFGIRIYLLLEEMRIAQERETIVGDESTV